MNKDQIRTGSASFLPALFEFSSPRLAVYEDKNPCSSGPETQHATPNSNATPANIAVAGMPFFSADTGATAKFTLLDFSKKSFQTALSALSKSEKAQISALGKAGHGVVQVTFTPSKESGATVKVMPALHLAWEDHVTTLGSQVVGKHGTVVERLFLAPESVEVLNGAQITSFPTGIELPAEAAAVFPSIYTDWAAKVLAQDQVIRAYTGPLNRCQLCYDKPPSLEVLHSAGVFWQSKVPSVNPANLRGQKADTPLGPALDTWLSRHILQKPKNKPLLISSGYARSSVSLSFVEQGSVERPFLGEIFCPAMEGYKKSLNKRREKTLVALNSLSGWNEEKLKTKTDAAGVVRPSWFQEHWENKP